MGNNHLSPMTNDQIPIKIVAQMFQVVKRAMQTRRFVLYWKQGRRKRRREMATGETRGTGFECPVCGKPTGENLGHHIRNEHGEDKLREWVLAAKEEGMPDPEIGRRYGISFNYLQQVVTEAYGTNISVLHRPKKIKRLVPKGFSEQSTTVWSFKQRGNWATHDGRYRGNWSPYIPRNVILKYSKPGDMVLDYFVGGATTAVEVKLLGPQCITGQINRGV